jgi:hypothetical protein
MAINTVQDLLDELNAIEDKTKPVFGFITTDKDGQYELIPIVLVDNDISDRVDLNFNITKEDGLVSHEDGLRKAFNDGKLYEAGELQLNTEGRNTAYEVWREANPYV